MGRRLHLTLLLPGNDVQTFLMNQKLEAQLSLISYYSHNTKEQMTSISPIYFAVAMHCSYIRAACTYEPQTLGLPEFLIWLPNESIYLN